MHLRLSLALLLLAAPIFAADAANDLLLAQRKSDNSGTIQRNVAVGNSGAPLLSAGAGFAPAFGALNLAGGTNIVTGTLPVANGGTGAATHTANAVLIGNGTSALSSVAPGTSGNVLTSNGTAWASAAPTGSGGDVTAASAFANDNRIVRSDGTGKGVQASGITIDDSDNISGIGDLSAATLTPTAITGATANGQIFVGNATNGQFAKTTLTAGTGITVTNGASSITLAATGEPAISAGTTAQYYRGDKSWQTLNSTAVGLGNVENTALSTWGGSTNIVTLGTVSTGTWSGTAVAVNKGGTGQTSYTNGQILVGNTTSGGLDKTTLTAGTGITITNGAGSITINSTASGGGAEKWDATFDGQGQVISANVTVYRAVATTGNITAGVLIADASGDATVSVTRHTPSAGALGTGTALGNLTLSSAVHSRDTTLTGWTKSVSAGDVLAIKTESATAATRLTVSLTQ